MNGTLETQKGSFQIFMFVGGIIGGVLGAIALIHSMVYMPLKGDITDLSCRLDKRYDTQVEVNMKMASSLGRIEARLGIAELK